MERHVFVLDGNMPLYLGADLTETVDQMLPEECDDPE